MGLQTSLAIRDLGYRYGPRWALRGVSAALQPGITGLLGPNGAGKTTLMRLSVGLLSPDEGGVSLLGGDPYEHPHLRSRVGYLPQHFSPPSSMRVGAYLECLALLSGRSAREARSGVAEALAAVGLSDRSRSTLGSLSGGMLRRVGVAQAIAHRPQLLIVDEPAAGLDPEERARLYRSLRDAAAERPVLVSSHMVDEIEREADAVWFLRRGELVWTGPVEEALAQMAGRVREGELPRGAAPRGVVVAEKRTAGGTHWRVIGEDGRLKVCQPTLLDAYLAHVGQGT
ncbi:ABC transporter ATP-binding protein [Truepera radiovictrix]|uniref:ABC transporter related protein n=1 Tax=Truepera radiovictrix (strain DSM 17093 / CIP 108686 / LMG 22925 / RQ-24) TaxID=649638 RepID=D7CVB2_TRURR|nr:ATP-binding cassette domain-containing protein [Truepera radiovictrix]ADI14140.1 ABC transporter related protein [Truepera radiovictrix DSM 17093]